MSIISQALLANPFKSKDFKWNTSTIMKPNGRGKQSKWFLPCYTVNHLNMTMYDKGSILNW